MTGTHREHNSQAGFAYRFGWGREGLEAVAAQCDVVVVVDVLRFSTAVSAAIEAGAMVLPYRWGDDGAAEYANARAAVLAGLREHGGPSLSPTDLRGLAPGTRVVLPSPNGSTIAFAASELEVPFVLAGSLRNATATARRAATLAPGGTIGVIAAGERWGDGPLRPALEDLIGAGAVLAALQRADAAFAPRCSPEASVAWAAFVDAEPNVAACLLTCESGCELVERGWEDDVRTAAELDATELAAQLVDDAFVGV